MSSRIQVVLREAERERFRQEAKKARMSLSAWMMAAAREKLGQSSGSRKIDSIEALESFFAACDEREQAAEPSWEEHERVIEKSKGSGSADS